MVQICNNKKSLRNFSKANDSIFQVPLDDTQMQHIWPGSLSSKEASDIPLHQVNGEIREERWGSLWRTSRNSKKIGGVYQYFSFSKTAIFQVPWSFADPFFEGEILQVPVNKYMTMSCWRDLKVQVQIHSPKTLKLTALHGLLQASTTNQHEMSSKPVPKTWVSRLPT